MMTTILTLTYPQSDEQVIPASLTTPLSAAADLFEVADRCAALVSVLIETDDRASRTALCEGLLHALRQLRERCDAELPPHLIAQLIQGETLTSCMPDCWQETAPPGGLCAGFGAGNSGWNLASKCRERTGRAVA